MAEFKRSLENPILKPNRQNAWEAEATFNGCPILHAKRIHLLYRAVSSPTRVDGNLMNLSTIGHAISTDGINFKYRRQFIKPEYPWEKYGCEDPRVTRVGSNYYVFYTALSLYPFTAEGVRIGLAITDDYQNIVAKHPITTFNSKAMVLFPGKIGRKIVGILSVNTDKPPTKIGLAFFDREDQMWSPEYWEGWYSFLDDHTLPLQRSPKDHVEVGAAPIRTPYGWLLIYSYIKNYLSPPMTFGIEGVLLDLKDPRRIIARTEKPWLVPEEFYEKYGQVPNVIFPSGAIVKRGNVYLYYGAADTTCAVATGKLSHLVEDLILNRIERVKLERYKRNPIIKPNPDHAWEAKAAFNPGALYEGGKVHLVYRAMSHDNTSVIGFAASRDGFTFDERYDEPVYTPREPFEQKLVPGGNTGCEDPRLTRFGSTVYMCYTAFDGRNMPRVALTSISLRDFLSRKWNWSKSILISPPGLMDKDAALFPKKINDRYAFLHRLGKSIWLDYKTDLKFDTENWLKGRVILSATQEPHAVEKIGLAAPPIETQWGWLMLYHLVEKMKDDPHRLRYYLSAALLDLRNPGKVISRRRSPLLEPEMPWEKDGQVANVVFPGGAVVIDDLLFVYYGGGDSVTAVATMRLSDLMESLLLGTVSD